MAAPVTTESAWKALAGNPFAVLSWVTPGGAARSAGIVYVVRERRLLIGTETNSWKARQIRINPSVSVTATFARRIPFVPWIRLPDATISFHGRARVIDPADVDPAVAGQLAKGMVEDPELAANTCLIEVTPEGEFVTYGIDVSLLTMRDPHKAHGRAAVD